MERRAEWESRNVLDSDSVVTEMAENSAVFSIEQNDERGRHLVAARDISAGDLILTDRPLIVTPHTKSKAQCLQCARLEGGGGKPHFHLILLKLDNQAG